MPAFKNILYEKKGRLAYITINRPDRRNAIDPDTSRELLEAFTSFKDDDDLWAAVLTGAGADLVALARAFASARGGAPCGGGGGRLCPLDGPAGGSPRVLECWKPMIA